MILSAQNLFSDQQAITATAASTNIIDLGAPGTPYGAAAALQQDIGKGTPVPILIQIEEAFNNLTSLDIAIQVDDNSGFSSPKTVHTETIALAALTVGKKSYLRYLPTGVDERYLRLNYTVTGTAPTTGKVTAGISMGVHSNE